MDGEKKTITVQEMVKTERGGGRHSSDGNKKNHLGIKEDR